MAETNPRITYKKLSARSVTSFTRNTLYLGPDHLMLVESLGFKENYRRLYFSDIQLAYAIPTYTSIWIASAIGGLAVILILLGMLNGVIAPFLIIASVFLVILLFQLVAGRSCNFYIKTAIAAHHVGAVGRVRRARQIMSRIAPLILAAQVAAGQQRSPETATLNAQTLKAPSDA